MEIIVFIIFGLVIQMRQSTVQPYLMDSTPHYIRSTIFGVYFGLSMEGQSLLQPAVGHLIDQFGINEIFQIITIISIVLSVLALLLLRKPRLR